MSAGVYVPGSSPLHRAAPGVKVLALAVFAMGLSLSDAWWALGVWLVVLVAAWLASGLRATLVAQSLKPLWLIFSVLFAFQWTIAGLAPALDTLLTLAALVVGAAVVSHTTRTDEMLETLKRALSPLARLGLNPQMLAFAVVFTVRLVPFVASVGREALAARIARGGARNPFAALVPTVIRLMRETDMLAEALVARGFART